MDALEVMIAEAETADRKVQDKIVMMLKGFVILDADKWNKLVTEKVRTTERMRTLYELRGRLGK